MTSDFSPKLCYLQREYALGCSNENIKISENEAAFKETSKDGREQTATVDHVVNSSYHISCHVIVFNIVGLN